MKILIAEDDLISRRLLRAWLEKWNYEVIETDNGEDALAAFASDSPPQIAILDWMMPRMEGVAVCREIRKRQLSGYCYIILLTARGQRDDLIRGLLAGADDYLVKPFEPRELELRLQAGRRVLQVHETLRSDNRELRELAYIDPLTGLWNRSAIEQILSKELRRATRSPGSVGVVMADLDHFKEINDLYGHRIGDVVLREVSRCLRTSARSYDSVGRFGGEEFLIVLPGCGTEAASRVAERMRHAIGELRISLPDSSKTLSITCSFGVSSVDCRIDFKPEDELLKSADSALYEAKRAGRNRVHSSEPRPEVALWFDDFYDSQKSKSA